MDSMINIRMNIANLISTTSHMCIRCGNPHHEDEMIYGANPYKKEIDDVEVEIGWRCKECHGNLLDAV